MTTISHPSYSPLISEVPKLIGSDKINPIAKGIEGVCNTNNGTPSNLVNMKAVPADSILDDAGKLTDSAKKSLNQEINQLCSKNSDPTPQEKAALFWKHVAPLLKAKLNEIHSNTPLLNIPADQPIDDSTFGSHFINQKALQGKLERFSNQIDSFKDQKLASAKATHLQIAFRALEESIETLIMPNSPSANSDSTSTASEGLKQPITGMSEVDGGRTPINDSTKLQASTASGDIHYHTHYHFGDSIHSVVPDKEFGNFNITVNVDGAGGASFVTTSSEKEFQRTPNIFNETPEVVTHELNDRQDVKDAFSEIEESIIKPISTQTLSQQQDIDTDDVVDGLSRVVSVEPIREEEQPTAPLHRSRSEPVLDTGGYIKGEDGKWTKEDQPAAPLLRSQSEPVLDTGGYIKGENGKWTKEDQPAAPLLRSQSEPVLNTDGYIKGMDGKWTNEKLHSKTDVVLSQGSSQSSNSNIAGKKAYSLSDVRGNTIDSNNAAKVTSVKTTQIDASSLDSQAEAGQTLHVTLNMDIDDQDVVKSELQNVYISKTTTNKPNFELSQHSESSQAVLKQSLSANDVQGADSSNINSRTGQPFKYSVSADKNVILTRDGQVSSLANKRSYSESDLRFKIEKSL